VPDPIHRTLKSRAAQAGMTLSDYLSSAVIRRQRNAIWSSSTRRQRTSCIA